MPRREVLLLFAIIWIGDSAAYYAGRALGRRPLAPTISPKKTVEGAIAGFIGSVVAGVIGGRWLLGGRRLGSWRSRRPNFIQPLSQSATPGGSTSFGSVAAS